MLESPINIRGLKKFAVDQMRADKVKTPKPNPSTGKKVAIIGGGPAGMTCAYFLALMGHKAVVYESHDKLGGMLRYGIPNYRFPKDRLDEDINAILGAGDVEVVYNTNVGKDIPIAKVQKNMMQCLLPLALRWERHCVCQVQMHKMYFQQWRCSMILEMVTCQITLERQSL